jgi:DNA helicase-4
MENLLVNTNLFGKLFGAIKKLEISNGKVFIEMKSGRLDCLDVSGISDIPSIHFGVFGCKLNLEHKGNKYSFSFLDKDQSEHFFKYIEETAIKSISKLINNANDEFHKTACHEYFRDSSVSLLEKKIAPLLDKYQNSMAVWQSKISPDNLKKIIMWKKYVPLSDGKSSLRREYESRQLVSRKAFFDIIESKPLTEKQRLSVIRSNDINLILAAAGTGKTSVMVAKALDLIDSKVAKPSEILILAYSNAAARELRERVVFRMEACGLNSEDIPEISTFHAQGRKILKECNIPTYMSDFSDDPLKLQVWVTDWLKKYISSSSNRLKKFIELSYQPVNPFSFESKKEYDSYLRDNDYRTLQGEKVKGYQELLISNWFFLNSVKYEYETPFISKRRIEVGFDYRPDFHFTDTNIYLEHFGTDREGNTRKDIDKEAYSEGIKSKRALHQECGTKLIETYHYDWVEDNLENRLSTLMSNIGIKTTPKLPGEVFEILNNSGYIDESAKRYLKCLEAIRVERLGSDTVLQRLTDNKIFLAKEYTELLGDLHTAYKQELDAQGRIDFDDMIIRSTDGVKSKKFIPHWSYILVDEFQDISMARMEFLNALVSNGPSPILTVVGDDWQSIYRFSGGKLELTTRFEELVGVHTLTKLEKTFRYNNSIADVAGTFVMQNPEQYKKEVVTHTFVKESQVYLLDSGAKQNSLFEDRILQVVSKIKENDPIGTVAILARYRYLLENAKLKISKSPFKGIKYWTFHGSKGLEADYCILVGFFQGKTGFPNSNKEEAVVESLLPSLDKFPHSEERRLLYVAITRARKKSYLIADPMAPSEFVNELLSPKYKLQIASKSFEEQYRKIFKCPVCSPGYFKIRAGKFGDFYSCTSGQVCNSKPRTCTKCGAPSLDTRAKSICNNNDCRDEVVICDRCGRPMKMRSGRFGEFLGCSGYGIKGDQCKNTRKN